MSYEVKRTDEQINDQLNLGNAWEEKGGTARAWHVFRAGREAGHRLGDRPPGRCTDRGRTGIMAEKRVGIESLYPAQCGSFRNDPARGAEYWGEVALISIDLMKRGVASPGEAGARAAVAAHFGNLLLERSPDAG